MERFFPFPVQEKFDILHDAVPHVPDMLPHPALRLLRLRPGAVPYALCEVADDVLFDLAHVKPFTRPILRWLAKPLETLLYLDRLNALYAGAKQAGTADGGAFLSPAPSCPGEYSDGRVIARTPDSCTTTSSPPTCSSTPRPDKRGSPASALLLASRASASAPASFEGDLILLAYLLGMMRFFTVIAALDTGSAFEGMGASREVQFSALAEPSLLLGLAALACKTGSYSLSSMLPGITPKLWTTDGPALAMVAVSLMTVLLAENARIPVDDPNRRGGGDY